MNPAPEHKEEMQNNLINSRKANIALIPKPHKNSVEIFFKEEEGTREEERRLQKFFTKNMSEIINKILADIIQHII